LELAEKAKVQEKPGLDDVIKNAKKNLPEKTSDFCINKDTCR